MNSEKYNLVWLFQQFLSKIQMKNGENSSYFQSFLYFFSIKIASEIWKKSSPHSDFYFALID